MAVHLIVLRVTLIYLYLHFLQEQKLNNLFIDPGNVKDFERPFKSKSKSDEQVDQSFSDHQAGESKPPNSGHPPSSFGVQSTSDEAQKS